MIGIVSQFKNIFIGVTLGAIAIFIYIAINSWHYKPIKELKEKNISLEKQLTETGRLLNICKADLDKLHLQGYIDGIGDNNEEPVIDFGNIVY